MDLTWEDTAPPGADVTGPASGHVHPLQPDGRRYTSYAEALARIERPALFENRPIYRLLAASLADGAPRLRLTHGRYFDWVNGGEAMAHELAAAWQAGDEAILGSEDYGGAVDYDRWPFFGELSAARSAGKLRVWCLGLGADPLTLAVDVLCVAVFASDVFDALFAGLVTANAEGRVTTGIPFTADVVRRFTGREPMQPAGAAVLELAWQHRKRLLG